MILAVGECFSDWEKIALDCYKNLASLMYNLGFLKEGQISVSITHNH